LTVVAIGWHKRCIVSACPALHAMLLTWLCESCAHWADRSTCSQVNAVTQRPRSSDRVRASVELLYTPATASATATYLHGDVPDRDRVRAATDRLQGKTVQPSHARHRPRRRRGSSVALGESPRTCQSELRSCTQERTSAQPSCITSWSRGASRGWGAAPAIHPHAWGCSVAVPSNSTQGGLVI
jgi:hypothetical protein